MLEEEVWLPVTGFEELYQISNRGRVRSLRLRTGDGLRKPYANKKGHLRIDLYAEGGERKKRYLHRLVLEAFIGSCPTGMEGCHKDGDPANNNLENLRWGTPQYASRG
jgi:hypothetical protein